MEGFDAGTRDLPAPPAGVAEETRVRLAEALTAIVAGATPEELAGYVEDGFPEHVAQALSRPGEQEEMLAHVDVLLSISRPPVGAGV